MHNIVKMFPEIFEINLEDKKWFNTLGLWDEMEIDKMEIDDAAIKHAFRTLDNPLEHVDAINEIIDYFKRGASWFICNKHLLEKISISECVKAIYIAICICTRKACEDIEPCVEWSIHNALNISSVIEDDIYSGVMWAALNDDGTLSLEISMVKQMLEDRHNSIIANLQHNCS